MARIVSYAQVGVDPKIMGTGPIPAVKKAVSLCDFLLFLRLFKQNFFGLVRGFIDKQK